MVNTIVFNDEITIWWRYDEYPCTLKYTFYLDGKRHGETTKTHYSFLGLQAERIYSVRIEMEENNGNILTEEYVFQTKKAKNRLDITKPPYSAAGDGETLNTYAIQRALNDCTANDFVYFPAGVYLTGALDVHSDTEIYLEEGANLQGSAKATDYLPKTASRFEGTELMCYRSLLNLGKLNRNDGYTTENIVIRGKGTIFGGGKPLALEITEAEREELKVYLEKNADYVKTCENENTIPGRVRGRLIQTCNCANVILSGLKLGYGASWNLHFIYSKDIVTYNCEVLSDNFYNENGSIEMENVWNGDGWDPDSSENCTVFHTRFNTYDDGIAIKSGKNPEGNIVNRPTKNICIFDCKGKNGVAIGSEISGGIDGVYMWDCEYLHSPASVNIKTTLKRGGFMRNIYVYNCDLLGFFVRTRLGYNNDGDGADSLTKIENIHLENVRLHSKDIIRSNEFIEGKPIYVDGFDGEENFVNGIVFKNVSVAKSNDNKQMKAYICNAKNVKMDITLL